MSILGFRRGCAQDAPRRPPRAPNIAPGPPREPPPRRPKTPPRPPKTPPRRPKTAPRRPQDAPRQPQDAPGGPQNGPENARRPLQAAREAPDPSRDPPGAKNSSISSFKIIDFRPILVGIWVCSRGAAPCFFPLGLFRLTSRDPLRPSSPNILRHSTSSTVAGSARQRPWIKEAMPPLGQDVPQ